MFEDDLVMENKTGEDMFEKWGSNASSIDRFITRNENHPFCNPWLTMTRMESKPEKIKSL